MCSEMINKYISVCYRESWCNSVKLSSNCFVHCVCLIWHGAIGFVKERCWNASWQVQWQETYQSWCVSLNPLDSLDDQHLWFLYLRKHIAIVIHSSDFGMHMTQPKTTLILFIQIYLWLRYNTTTLWPSVCSRFRDPVCNGMVLMLQNVLLHYRLYS